MNADNQICFSALCGIERRRAQAGSPHNSGVLSLALTALRASSARRGFCIDCPYRGGCQSADDANLIDARHVDAHVPIRWHSDTGSDDWSG